MSKLIVQEGQNIYDVVIQEFGDLDSISDFLNDNPDIEINDDLVSGQDVEIDNINKGNQDVKSEFVKINFVTNNKDTNFIASVQDQKQFQNGDGFDFQDGDAFEYN